MKERLQGRYDERSSDLDPDGGALDDDPLPEHVNDESAQPIALSVHQTIGSGHIGRGKAERLPQMNGVLNPKREDERRK